MVAWKIERRAGACSVCAREFADGERHASVLVVALDGLARREVCIACWRAGTHGRATGEPGEPGEPGAQSPAQGDAPQPAHELFWWFTRHAVESRKTVQMDLESLERLFVNLDGRTEQSVRELRYVLCLLLMRKRRVKLDKVERGDEGESFLVRRPRHEERYRVFVFDFTAERMDEIRAELQAIFDGAEGEDGVHLDLEQDAEAQPEVRSAPADEGEPRTDPAAAPA